MRLHHCSQSEALPVLAWNWATAILFPQDSYFFHPVITKTKVKDSIQLFIEIQEIMTQFSCYYLANVGGMANCSTAWKHSSFFLSFSYCYAQWAWCNYITDRQLCHMWLWMPRLMVKTLMRGRAADSGGTGQKPALIQLASSWKVCVLPFFQSCKYLGLEEKLLLCEQSSLSLFHDLTTTNQPAPYTGSLTNPLHLTQKEMTWHFSISSSVQ